MGWVTLTLRKAELKRTHADYQMELLNISRTKRQMARQYHYRQTCVQNDMQEELSNLYADYVTRRDAATSAMRVSTTTTTTNGDDSVLAGGQTRSEFESGSSSTTSSSIDTEAYNQAQIELNAAKEDYEQLKNIAKQNWEDQLAMIEEEANDTETMLDQDQVEIEAQLEAISAEIEAVGEAVSSQIQSSTIKLS